MPPCNSRSAAAHAFGASKCLKKKKYPKRRSETMTTATPSSAFFRKRKERYSPSDSFIADQCSGNCARAGGQSPYRVWHVRCNRKGHGRPRVRTASGRGRRSVHERRGSETAATSGTSLEKNRQGCAARHWRCGSTRRRNDLDVTTAASEIREAGRDAAPAAGAGYGDDAGHRANAAAAH